MTVLVDNETRVRISLDIAKIPVHTEEWKERLKAYQKIDIIAHRYNQLIDILTAPPVVEEDKSGETQDD